MASYLTCPHCGGELSIQRRCLKCSREGSTKPSDFRVIFEPLGEVLSQEEIDQTLKEIITGGNNAPHDMWAAIPMDMGMEFGPGSWTMKCECGALARPNDYLCGPCRDML